MRIKGHRLSMQWSGEYGEESSSTGRCTCGWTESCSNQNEVRNEYHFHLIRVREREAEIVESLAYAMQGDMEMAVGRTLGLEECKKILMNALRLNQIPQWVSRITNFASQIEKYRKGLHEEDE